MKESTLFQKDFTLLIIGQIISLFGNSILRFSLSLYILDVTGSAAAFGSILAVSMIPTILLSPFGGVLADRVNRRNIMICLDIITSLVCILFLTQLGSNQIVYIVAGVMIILSIIQSMYQPAVQSSIPVLVDSNHLLQANGVVVQVNALANFLGPILGGMLYGFLDLKVIVIVSAIAFFISSLLEVFIRIPFIKQASNGKVINTVIVDLKLALTFISKDNQVLFKILLVVASINLFFSSMIMIGLPYIIKVQLGLSSQLYGFAESFLAIGSIGAGLSIGLVGKKYSIHNSHVFIILGGVMLIPIAIVSGLQIQPMIAYIVICISTFLCLASVGIFTIFAQTFIQTETPNEMLGKVSAVVATIVMCSYPIGQSLYGVLFDRFSDQVFVIVLFAILVEVLLGIMTKRYLTKLQRKPMSAMNKY
ncbi:MFS transporter [Cytobacillus solani]|uniref:MFS transporter n=1 Tax=Cytobacillus solani TaxID=1637975 RepID=A0A0Q3VJZ5_9BACI|nr:MFS transporter [Cytobacillus solani]KOP71841.1 MFS transporter [Bacillus sp. FJAT-21945]KQL21482.1 MFS transporter [Cytobacillus solani]